MHSVCVCSMLRCWNPCKWMLKMGKKIFIDWNVLQCHWIHCQFDISFQLFHSLIIVFFYLEKSFCRSNQPQPQNHILHITVLKFLNVLFHKQFLWQWLISKKSNLISQSGQSSARSVCYTITGHRSWDADGSSNVQRPALEQLMTGHGTTTGLGSQQMPSIFVDLDHLAFNISKPMMHSSM